MKALIFCIGLLLLPAYAVDNVSAVAPTRVNNAAAIIPILNFLLDSHRDNTPTITLLGAKDVTVQKGNAYIDAGATANDNEDGEIKVITTGLKQLDTSKAALYKITYTAIDSDNNKAIKTRTVEVVAEELSAAKIVEASSLDSHKITVSWMAAEDANTAQKDLRYTLHLSENNNFQPNSRTKNTQVKNILSAVATGLKANTQYYVRVVATNKNNKESWSDILAIKTVATVIKRTAQTVVVQATDQPIITENSITFKDKGEIPKVGDIITNEAGESYLRTVTGVTKKDGQVTVKTADATLATVFETLDLATTIKVRKVESKTKQLARQQQAMMQIKVVGSQQHINWQASGLTLISQMPPPSAQQIQAIKQQDRTEVVDGQQIKTGSHGQLKAPAYLSTAPDTTLYFSLEAKTTQASNDWEICKIKLIDIEHDDSALEAGAKPQIGETVITDVEQKGTLNAVWTPSTQHIDRKGRPYHFIFTAFIDDKGEDCNGDKGGHLWDETITVDIPVYVSFGEEDAQADIENKKLTFTGDFSVEDTLTFEFIPELTIAASIKRSTLQYALIKASTDIKIVNTLTIKASGAGHLADEQLLISPRKFIKVFVTPLGIPIVVGGEFSLKAKIEGNVTGKMQLTKRLELAFPNTSFGMEYDASRSQKWGSSVIFVGNHS